MSNDLLKRAAVKDEYHFLKEFIKTQMYTVLVEDFFNKNFKMSEQLMLTSSMT